MFYTSPEFWVAVALIALLVIAWKPAKKAILGGLDAERAKIAAELEEAKNLRKEAEAALEHARKRHQDIASETETLLQHAREESFRLRRQSADELTKLLAAREKQGAQRIAQMEATLLADLKRLTVHASMDIVKQLLHEHIDSQKAAQLTDQAIADLLRKAAA